MTEQSRIVRILDRGRERCAIVTFALAGWEPEPLKEALTARRINSSVSLREHAIFDFDEKGVMSALRLSPHYYNTEAEIDLVVNALGDIVGGESSSRRP